MEDRENDPVVRQTVHCRKKEREREGERKKGEMEERKHVRGARVAPRDLQCVMIGYRHARKEAVGWRGEQRTHLQWCHKSCGEGR